MTEVLEAFYNYSWPGNVRELENTIESAMNYAPLNRRYLEKEDFIPMLTFSMTVIL